MGYPGSVFSFTTKSAGQTIQSATINDLQNEVTAIESALITGPVTLAASTLGSLSVTGGSTVGALTAGNSTLAALSVTGGSTFAGPLVISSGVTFGANGSIALPRIACKVQYTLNTIAVTGAFVGVNWDNEITDASGMHSTSANSSRITFAHSTGLYLVGAHVPWNTSTGGSRQFRIVLNDIASMGGMAVRADDGTGDQTVLSHSVLVPVTSTTDYVTVQVIQNSGSTGSLANSTSFDNSFWCFKVSA